MANAQMSGMVVLSACFNCNPILYCCDWYLFPFSSGNCPGSWETFLTSHHLWNLVWFHFRFLLFCRKLSWSEADDYNNLNLIVKCHQQDRSCPRHTSQLPLNAGSRVPFPNTFTFCSLETFFCKTDKPQRLRSSAVFRQCSMRKNFTF